MGCYAVLSSLLPHSALPPSPPSSLPHLSAVPLQLRLQKRKVRSASGLQPGKGAQEKRGVLDGKILTRGEEGAGRLQPGEMRGRRGRRSGRAVGGRRNASKRGEEKVWALS